MKLLTSQKAEIIKTLVAAGFQAKDFKIIEIPVSEKNAFSSTDIQYIPIPQYYFSLKESKSTYHSYRAILVPGEQAYKDSHGIETYIGATEYLNNWLKYLKRELDAEDTLTRLMNEVKEEDFDFVSSNKKEYYGSEEKVQIKFNIGTLKMNIVNLNLLPVGQLKLIEDKLTDIEEKLEELDKSGWRIFCVGTFVTIMSALTMSQETGKILWHLFLDFMSTQLYLK
jgi:hypothetical protein